MVVLNVNTSTNAEICAKNLWNHTNIKLIANQEYYFEATGEWFDAYGQIACNADGFSSGEVGRPYLWLVEWLRRSSSDKWFSLIGSIDKSKQTYFKIGSNLTFKSPCTGELVCFANDVIGFYKNNSGVINLQVTRIS